MSWLYGDRNMITKLQAHKKHYTTANIYSSTTVCIGQFTDWNFYHAGPYN